MLPNLGDMNSSPSTTGSPAAALADRPQLVARRVINGAAVRAIRELLGVRHGVFAIECDITPGYLSNIEAGRKQPSPAVQRAIANRLGVPLDAITQVINVPADDDARGVAA